MCSHKLNYRLDYISWGLIWKEWKTTFMVWIWTLTFFFFLFFFYIKGTRERENYRGRSLPLLNLIEDKNKEEVRMLPNKKWETSHLAIRCASELTHLEFFKAFQLRMESRRSWTSKIIGAEIRSKKRLGSLISRIVSSESPSMRRGEQPGAEANLSCVDLFGLQRRL